VTTLLKRESNVENDDRVEKILNYFENADMGKPTKA
jgi:hypothetical protein